MTLLDALQATLAAEHVAVYGYGVCGGRLRGTSQLAAITAAYDTHRSRRATLRELVTAANGSPVPAAAAYDIGDPITTPSQALALAVTVERGAAAAYADLVAAASGSLRSSASAWLAESAVRVLGWGAAPTTFPGLTERRG